MVWKLDRLGRSVRDLITLVSELQDRGIHFRSLTDSIDTSTPAGRFFFHVMSALAEMERELIVERTRAGLAAAREQGRVGGRRRIMTGGGCGTLPPDAGERSQPAAGFRGDWCRCENHLSLLPRIRGHRR